MTTETHHRLNCTPAQFTALVAILEHSRGDAENSDLMGLFVIDGRWRTLTAPRFAWNRLADSASPIYAVQVEHEGISTKARERAIKDMLQDKGSTVAVEVAESVPKGALF